MFPYTFQLPRVISILILLVVSFPVWSADAQESFDKGLSAVKSDDYQSAVRYFEQARTAGLNTATLHYNLGVSYYKLERYSDAETAFAKAARSPDMAALAHYNLGLVALAQGNKRKAERMFDQVLKESGSDKLSALAATQLDRLRKDKSAGDNGLVKSLSGIVTGEIGYDDNVTLEANDINRPTGKDDMYYSVFVYGDGRAIDGRKHDLRLAASLYSTRYQDFDIYNEDDVELGAVLEQKIKDWNVDAGAHLGWTYLDSSGFTRSQILRVQGKHRLSKTQQLRLRYEFNKIDELDSVYAYLGGWRQRFRMDSTWKYGGKHLRLTYQLELNDREDLLTPRFTSFSPTRHSVRAQGKLPVTDKLDAVLEGRYRFSKYNDASEQADGSFVTREEDRYRLIAKAVYYLAKNADLSGEYNYTKNDSNLVGNSYTRNQYMLRISYLW